MIKNMPNANLNNITPEQTALMEKYHNDYKKLTLSTERCDREKSEQALTKIYIDIFKFNKPEFHWFESPMAALLEINKKLGNKEQQFIKTSHLGNQDAYWIAFYLFCRDIGVEFSEEQSHTLDLWNEHAKYGGLVYFYDTDCFCVDRPTQLHFNENAKMHNLDGPAMEYADGWRLYAINGEYMPSAEWEKKRLTFK